MLHSGTVGRSDAADSLCCHGNRSHKLLFVNSSSLSQSLAAFSHTKYLHAHKPVSPLSQLIICFLFSFMSQQLTALSDDQHPCVPQPSADVFLAVCGVRAEPNKTCCPPRVAQREKVRDSPTQTDRFGVSYLDFWLRGTGITPRD